MPDLNLEPVVNSRIPYISSIGLYSVASDETLLVSDIKCSNSTNEIDMSVTTANAVGTTVSLLTTGLNGLDQGAAAASTVYALYVLSDAYGFNPSGFILSTNVTTPLIPTGYGAWRRVGWAFTDASSDLIDVIITGNGSDKHYQYDNAIAVLTAGTSASKVNIDMGAITPPKNTVVELVVAFTPNAASDTASIYNGNSSSSLPAVVTGQVAAVVVNDTIIRNTAFNTSAWVIAYALSTASAAATIRITGFWDYE